MSVLYIVGCEKKGIESKSPCLITTGTFHENDINKFMALSLP